MSDTKLIFKKIAAVMAGVGAIGKERRNDFHKYNFRGIDDVYNAAHPLFVEHGIFSVPRVLKTDRSERQSHDGKAMFFSVVEMEYTFYAEDGSSIVASAVGEGMDSGDKATNKAMSAAHKYAIIQLLSIPTVEPKDSEIDSHEVKPTPRPAAVVSSDPGSYVIPFGRKYIGKRLDEIGPHDADSFGKWLKSEADKKGQPLTGQALEAFNAIAAFTKSREVPKVAR